MTIAQLVISENASATQLYQTIQRARIAGLTIQAVATSPTTFRFEPPT